jgi:hypothetical protein
MLSEWCTQGAVELHKSAAVVQYGSAAGAQTVASSTHDISTACLCFLQANLFIDPNGGIALLSTHEKIFVSPYRCVRHERQWWPVGKPAELL